VPLELDQFRANLVLRGTEEPDIVDVPCVVPALLESEVDRKQETGVNPTLVSLAAK
jgi:hypothetical protein